MSAWHWSLPCRNRIGPGRDPWTCLCFPGPPGLSAVGLGTRGSLERSPQAPALSPCFLPDNTRARLPVLTCLRISGRLPYRVGAKPPPSTGHARPQTLPAWRFSLGKSLRSLARKPRVTEPSSFKIAHSIGRKTKTKEKAVAERALTCNTQSSGLAFFRKGALSHGQGRSQTSLFLLGRA